VNTQWVAALSDDASSRLDPLTSGELCAAGYSAVAIRYPLDGPSHAWALAIASTQSMVSLPVWLWLRIENATRGSALRQALTHYKSSANAGEVVVLLECVASDEVCAAYLTELRSLSSELGLAPRIILTRTPFQSALDEDCELLDWHDGIETDPLTLTRASAWKDGVMPLSEAVAWVSNRLELMRQSPADTHRSIILPGTGEQSVYPRAGATIGVNRRPSSLPVEAVGYWLREIEIIARNNPSHRSRFVVVRGDPWSLNAYRRRSQLAASPRCAPSTDDEMVYHGATTQTNAPSIAVVAHLHYVDLWPEFARALGAIAEPFDLYLTVPAGLARAVSTVAHTSARRSTVVALSNRGRDILPFFIIHQHYDLSRYEVVCKIHSKRSLHVSKDRQTALDVADGNEWRRRLLQGLLGSQKVVADILSELRKPEIGMLCPREFLKETRTGTLGSELRLHQVVRLFGAVDLPPATVPKILPRIRLQG
jgi:hypothetical protein